MLSSSHHGYSITIFRKDKVEFESYIATPVDAIVRFCDSPVNGVRFQPAFGSGQSPVVEIHVNHSRSVDMPGAPQTRELVRTCTHAT